MSAPQQAAISGHPSGAQIEQWLRATVAELIEVTASDVDTRIPFSHFGVDSASALIVTDMLSDWLGLELDATLLYEHETIETLASHLVERLASASATTTGP